MSVDPGYDLFLDFDVIVASFYELGYRLAGKDSDMSYREFVSILSCLSPESPLGRLVRIRLETNPDILKQYTPQQKKIQMEWRLFRAERIQKEMRKMTKEEKEGMYRAEKDFSDALFASFKK